MSHWDGMTLAQTVHPFQRIMVKLFPGWPDHTGQPGDPSSIQLVISYPTASRSRTNVDDAHPGNSSHFLGVSRLRVETHPIGLHRNATVFVLILFAHFSWVVLSPQPEIVRPTFPHSLTDLIWIKAWFTGQTGPLEFPVSRSIFQAIYFTCHTSGNLWGLDAFIRN